MRVCCAAFLVLLSCAFASPAAHAQDNYEIQVYGADTVPAGATMVELHSNFTIDGRRNVTDGLLPTDHAFHETLEITHGFNDWFETGFYVFTSARSGNGWQWVGDHIRPRVRAPERWHWPVGVSLSAEVGYQRRDFSVDTWTFELRPIVDKQLGPWYLAFNPAFEKSLHGANSHKGFEFSPNVKASYDVSKQVALGVEYYGAFGPVDAFDAPADQQHQFFGTLDLNVSPKWEFNAGLGVGVTRSTDHLIFKTIVGYRFDRIPLLQHPHH